MIKCGKLTYRDTAAYSAECAENSDTGIYKTVYKSCGGIGKSRVELRSNADLIQLCVKLFEFFFAVFFTGESLYDLLISDIFFGKSGNLTSERRLLLEFL